MKIKSVFEIAKSNSELNVPDSIDLQGWNSDSEIFYNLVNEIKPNTIVEVGTWKGRSAARWLEATASAGLETKLYCVDSWLGGIDHYIAETNRLLDSAGSPRIYHQFIKNFIDSKHSNRIYPIQQTSVNGARILSHYKIKADIIYIDAGHEYEDVIDDLKYYWPVLEKNGKMFGDDFYNFSGVSKAVEEFSKLNNLSFDVVENNFWILK